jgi:hypothetical protein
MASTAINAQGSTVYIGSGSGSAKTITAIALGFPTLLTAAAHGFANGDVVALAGLGGANAATLNGNSYVVRNKTANTWAIDVDTTGLTITASGTATPVAFTKISNIKTFETPEASSSEVDVSNLDSTGKEFLMGLRDGGTVSLDTDYDKSDAGQVACRAAWLANPQPLKPFKILLPDATAVTFNAYVKKAPIKGGVDQALKSTIDLRVSGGVTIA